MKRNINKFAIKFTDGTCSEKGIHLTKIMVNGCLVGFIYPPKYCSHSATHFHISVFESCMDSPMIKALPGLFEKQSHAEKFIKENLKSIHENGTLGLYFNKEISHELCY